MTTDKTVDLVALTSNLIIKLNKILASCLRSYKVLINRDGVRQFHKLLSRLAKARHQRFDFRVEMVIVEDLVRAVNLEVARGLLKAFSRHLSLQREGGFFLASIPGVLKF
jgi:hypothetical protein